MTRQNISIGTSANDGTGDTLRSAGQKINENFAEIYETLSGDSSKISASVSFQDSAIRYLGSPNDAHETFLRVVTPTADRDITFPNDTGTVLLDSSTNTIKNKTINIADNTITATTTIGSTAVNLGGSATTFAGISSLQTETLTNATGNLLVNSHTYITEFRGGGSTEGMIQLNCAVNSHGQIIRSAPHSVGATNTLILPGGSTIGNDSATLLSDIGTQTIRNKTLAANLLNEPKIGKAINDSSGNQLISFTKTASAVNHVNVTNKNTSNHPIIGAAGDDTNINLTLSGKGKGSVAISKAAYVHDDITANGAADSAATLIIGNKGSALAVTLGDGTTTGEFKIFTNKGAGAMTVTPTNFAGGASFELAQNEGTTCIWDGSNWFLIGNQSVMTIS